MGSMLPYIAAPWILWVYIENPLGAWPKECVRKCSKTRHAIMGSWAPENANLGTTSFAENSRKRHLWSQQKWSVCTKMIPPICDPWCWYIDLQNWVIFKANVGKCSSTMEHMSCFTTNLKQSFGWISARNHHTGHPPNSTHFRSRLVARGWLWWLKIDKRVWNQKPANNLLSSAWSRISRRNQVWYQLETLIKFHVVIPTVWPILDTVSCRMTPMVGLCRLVSKVAIEILFPRSQVHIWHDFMVLEVLNLPIQCKPQINGRLPSKKIVIYYSYFWIKSSSW